MESNHRLVNYQIFRCHRPIDLQAAQRPATRERRIKLTMVKTTATQAQIDTTETQSLRFMYCDRIGKTQRNLRERTDDIPLHYLRPLLRIRLIRIDAPFPSMPFELYSPSIIKLHFNNRRIFRSKPCHNPDVAVYTLKYTIFALIAQNHHPCSYDQIKAWLSRIIRFRKCAVNLCMKRMHFTADLLLRVFVYRFRFAVCRAETYRRNRECLLPETMIIQHFCRRLKIPVA